MKRLGMVARTILFSLAVVSCSDNRPSAPASEEEETPAPPGILVSNPSAGSSAAMGTAARSDVAYIAAAPGSLGNATAVIITNRTRNGTPVTVSVINGGFDPVAVDAEVGDDIALEIVAPAGITIATIKVPPRRPPAVVRTSPPKGRTDVAVNVQIEVIFSEPLDKGSVTASSMSLTTGGIAVPGRIEITNDGLRASFTPDNPLQPGTTYSFNISTTILDHDGESLQNGATIDFTTLPESSQNQAAGRLAFLSYRDGNTEIYSSNGNGSDLVRLTNSPGYDGEIAWSPDGSRIAFVSERAGEVPGRRDIYIMNANGTGVTQLTTTGYVSHPTWSPDGKEIAFAYDESPFVFGPSAGDIAIIDVERGEDSRRYLGLSGLGAAQPVWSPDGTRIAFLAGRGYYDEWSSVYTVKPDGGPAEKFMEVDGLTFSYPRFSPDGKKLSVQYCRGNDALIQCNGSAGIALASYPGGALTFFMDRRGTTYWPSYFAVIHPAWSPDGRNLAFSAFQCQGCALSIAYTNMDSGAVSYLINNAFDAEWRPAK